jgi:hypothetical protein
MALRVLSALRSGGIWSRYSAAHYAVSEGGARLTQLTATADCRSRAALATVGSAPMVVADAAAPKAAASGGLFGWLFGRGEPARAGGDNAGAVHYAEFQMLAGGQGPWDEVNQRPPPSL